MALMSDVGAIGRQRDGRDGRGHYGSSVGCQRPTGLDDGLDEEGDRPMPFLVRHNSLLG